MTDDLEHRLRDLLAERSRVDPQTVRRALAAIDELPARRVPMWRSPGALLAAVLVLAVVGVGLVAVLRPASVASPKAAPTASSAAPTPRSPGGTTLQPPPVWAVDLVGHLDCDAAASSIGMETDPDPVPFDAWPTPDEALEDFLADRPSLPSTGFSAPLIDGRWALHRYLVEGRPKVHAVSTNQFPGAPSEARWQVVGLRACQPEEFTTSTGSPS